MKQPVQSFIAFVAILLLAVSCFYDNEEALYPSLGSVCDTINPVTFSGAIWPEIQNTCKGCHSGSSPSGSVVLTNYTNVAAAAANGSLLNSLHGTGVPRKMPPGSSLSPCKINQFEIWVRNGALNN